jgi:hypothetical protein
LVLDGLHYAVVTNLGINYQVIKVAVPPFLAEEFLDEGGALLVHG